MVTLVRDVVGGLTLKSASTKHSCSSRCFAPIILNDEPLVYVQESDVLSLLVRNIKEL